MQNELEREIELKRAGYVAAVNAIRKRLGKNATNEAVLDIIILMAHMMLTDNYQHPTGLALHNLNYFNQQLHDLITESQKDIAGKGCGALM